MQLLVIQFQRVQLCIVMSMPAEQPNKVLKPVHLGEMVFRIVTVPWRMVEFGATEESERSADQSVHLSNLN